MTASHRLSGRILTGTPIGSWAEDAECAKPGYHPETWFPEKRKEREPDGTVVQRPAAVGPAKWVCRNLCKVREECLAYALANRDDYGVFGGLTAKERRRLLKRKLVAA